MELDLLINVSIWANITRTGRKWGQDMHIAVGC